MSETYRQLSRKLRIHRPGHPDKVSERPFRETRTGREYLDSDEAPTLITFDELDEVNVGALLRSGAIVAWSPPTIIAKPPAKPYAGKEVVADDKNSSE